jgi:hypothetical protein
VISVLVVVAIAITGRVCCIDCIYVTVFVIGFAVRV